MTWFTRTKVNSDFIHPMLGKFCYCGSKQWRGMIRSNGEGFPVTVAGIPSEPDFALLEAISTVADNFDHFRHLAEAFISREQDIFKPEDTELYALMAFYPNKEWIKHMMRVSPNAFKAINSNTPLTVLTYAIEKAQNVIDVTFVSETPINIDYH